MALFCPAASRSSLFLPPRGLLVARGWLWLCFCPAASWNLLCHFVAFFVPHGLGAVARRGHRGRASDPPLHATELAQPGVRTLAVPLLRRRRSVGARVSTRRSGRSVPARSGGMAPIARGADCTPTHPVRDGVALVVSHCLQFRPPAPPAALREGSFPSAGAAGGQSFRSPRDRHKSRHAVRGKKPAGEPRGRSRFQQNEERQHSSAARGLARTIHEGAYCERGSGRPGGRTRGSEGAAVLHEYGSPPRPYVRPP
jgi:hypothetical protein